MAQDLGLQSLDLPSADPEAVAELSAAGLSLGSVDAQGVAKLLSRDTEVRREAVRSLQDQLRAVAGLGGRVLFLCPVPEEPTLPRKEGLDIFCRELPEVVRVAEEVGVRIALEGWPGPAPHYPTVAFTPETYRYLFRAVSSSALGLCYDPSHLVRLGIDPVRFLQEFQDRIAHCHAKDTALLAEGQYLYGTLPPTLDPALPFGGGAWRYTIPGHGEVRWSQVLAGLATAGYRGTVSIELEDFRYAGTAEREQAGLRLAANYLRPLLL